MPDSLGVYLFRPEMTDIWAFQKRHIPYIVLGQYRWKSATTASPSLLTISSLSSSLPFLTACRPCTTPSAVGRLMSPQLRCPSNSPPPPPYICDVKSMPFYTATGVITKGNVQLPVYWCSHGTTSLKSFHLHVNCMIPGTSASGSNMQANLVKGVYRWNIRRGSDSLAQPDTECAHFNIKLKLKVNALNEALFV